MNETKNMRNRQLEKYYHDKAVEEDQKKIEAFNKTAFTETVMSEYGEYTIQEFKEAGKMVADAMGNYLSKARDDIEVARKKKNTKSAKPAETKSAPVQKQVTANQQVLPQTQVPIQQKPISNQSNMPQRQSGINYTPM